jgi:WD40 repeat protein
VTFSPDGSQVAVTVSRGDRLGVQLVGAATMRMGHYLDAHHGAYDPLSQPNVADPAIYSDDGSELSLVASRGPGHPTNGEAPIATFDSHSGARIDRPGAAGASQEVVGASHDLRALAVLTDTGVGIIDAGTGAPLAEIPTSGLDPIPPVAFDPTGTEVVVQSSTGALTVSDWTRVGAPHFLTTSEKTGPAAIGLAPTGTTVDLTGPLRQLGLPRTCFAPITSPCDLATDRAQANAYANHQIPLRAADPSHAWSAVVSEQGQAAILHGTEIAIWDPTSGHIVRRLTGVPARCDGFYPQDLVFRGTADAGRVVLGCAPSLLSWDLGSSSAEPEWRVPWAGPAFNVPTPVLLSPDRSTVAVTILGGMRFIDARIGKLRAKGPTVAYDNQTWAAFSPDSRTIAQLHWSGAVDLLDPTTGSLRRTLTSSLGNINDLGVGCLATCGGNGGKPAIAFNPDGSIVGVWHDTHGMELWDTRTGESLAVVDGRNNILAGTLSTIAGTGTYDDTVAHRLEAHFDRSGDTLHLTDVHSVAGLADGRSTGEYSSALRNESWSLRPADWTRAACDLVGRDLTLAEWRTLVSATAPPQRTCTAP